MTSDAQKAKGWLLPEQIKDYQDFVCYSFQVPDVREYRTAFIGAVLQLTKYWNWERSGDPDDRRATEAATYWRNILYPITECDEDTGCRDFLPSATFIDYEPQDPFTEPDLIPSGYILPPFYTVTSASLPDLLGYQVGDVLTDITRFPAGTGVITDPESGWARFRIHLTGAGIVRMTFLNVPLGGYALVTVDDDPLSAAFVELNLDLVAAPPENNMTVGHERRFTEDIEHHIDVTFVPRFNDEVPAAYYGGGFRGLSLCGFGEMQMDVRQNEEAPCTLEKTMDGGETWTAWANLQLCPPDIRVNKGIVQWRDPITDTWQDVDGGDEREDGDATPAWPSPPAGQTGNCLAAENITAVYQTSLTQLRAGLELGLISSALAAGVTATLTPFIPPALISTVALAIGSAALSVGIAGLDTMLQYETHIKQFKCSISDNIQSDGSVTAANFSALRADMATWAGGLELVIIQNWLDALGSVGLTRMGDAAGITSGDCDCTTSGIWQWKVWDNTTDTPTMNINIGNYYPVNGHGKKTGATQFDWQVGRQASTWKPLYMVAIASRLMPNFINTYGTTLEVKARMLAETDSKVINGGRFVNNAANTAWSNIGGSFTTPTNYAEFTIAAYNLATLTTSKKILFYMWSYSKLVITRILVDGVEAP